MSKTITPKQKFFTETLPSLRKSLGLENKSSFMVPRPIAVKVNVGIGTYITAGKDYEDVVRNVATITGQKPVVAKSRIAISNFKLKIGMPTGVSVTLRGDRMYQFLEKLIHVVLPRIRDFRGLSPKAFDGRGNYSLGIKEHTVFPEISSEDINKIHGLQVTIVTTAKDDQSARAMLTAMHFPFKKD
ncbi:MAG: 50S ribosomal protein L5 [Patescibacteria group bacterium]